MELFHTIHFSILEIAFLSSLSLLRKSSQTGDFGYFCWEMSIESLYSFIIPFAVFELMHESRMDKSFMMTAI